MKKNTTPNFFTVALFCQLWICISSLSLDLAAQNVPQTFGARASALGNAAANEQSLFSIFSNQAGLASLEGVAAGVHLENRFLI